MKILTVNQSDKIVGGSDIYWKMLNELLLSKGHEVVSFYSSNRDEAMPADFSLSRLDYKYAIKYFYNIEAKKKLYKLLENENVDIAHLNIFYGKLSVSILDVFKDLKIPVVQTLHEYKICCPVYTMMESGDVCRKCKNSRYYNCLLYKCNKNSYTRSFISAVEQYFSKIMGVERKINSFVCVSEYQRQMIKSMNASIKKLTVIQNFIDLPKFEPTSYTGEYFLYFGRIEKVKGVETLLKAIKFLKEQLDTTIPLLIIGNGEYLPKAKIYCDDNGLNNVRFIPHCSRRILKEYVRSAICTILPSIWGETFGMTILEAMALKIPPIVSGIGGMPEIINDSVDGFVFPPKDYKMLAEKMLFLAQNPIVARNMGERGRSKVEKQYGADQYYNKIMNLYSQACHGRSN